MNPILGRKMGVKWTMAGIAQYLTARACSGLWDGKDSAWAMHYLDRCKVLHLPTGSTLIFTKEYGYHSSGWWKNPDYERCFHLSLSFRDPITHEQAPLDKKLTKEWLTLFFGADQSLLWTEPPYSERGKQLGVYHYRLFCSDGFLMPIKPRGEVYSRDWTPAGWLSFSDLQEHLREEASPDSAAQRSP